MKTESWLKCHGTATVGEKGQVVLPAETRRVFEIKPGDKIIVLGAKNNGFERVVLMKSEAVTEFMQHMFDLEKFLKGDMSWLDQALKEGKKMKEKARARKKKR